MVIVFSDPAGEDPIGEVARLVHMRSSNSRCRGTVMESHSLVMYWESAILMFFSLQNHTPLKAGWAVE